MQFGLMFSALSNCRKAIESVNSLRKVPEEAAFLWQLLDAIQRPVELAQSLSTRQQTAEHIRRAIAVTYECVLACDGALSRDDPGGRPFEGSAWDEWWTSIPAAAKDLTRIQLVPKLTLRLQQAVGVLQLGLASAQLELQVTDRSILTHTARLAAIDTARHLFHLFEAGRLDCAAHQYQLGTALCILNKASTGRVGLVLKRETAGNYVLQLRDLEATGTLRAEQAKKSGASVFGSGFVNVLPPTTESSLSIASVDLARLKSLVRHSRPGSASVPRFELVDASGKAVTVLQFISCDILGQLCFFPGSGETYHHVTVDAFELLLGMARGIQEKQLDAVCPIVEEDGTSHESSLLSLAAFDKFIAQHMTSH